MLETTCLLNRDIVSRPGGITGPVDAARLSEYPNRSAQAYLWGDILVKAQVYVRQSRYRY